MRLHKSAMSVLLGHPGDFKASQQLQSVLPLRSSQGHIDRFQQNWLSIGSIQCSYAAMPSHITHGPCTSAQLIAPMTAKLPVSWQSWLEVGIASTKRGWKNTTNWLAGWTNTTNAITYENTKIAFLYAVQSQK